MNGWLQVRGFLALFVLIFGFGLMFGRSDDMRLLLGALFAAIGLAFLLRLVATVRRN
jgi:hypothetical protein